MPIAKEISSMFEFNRNKKKPQFPIDNNFDECPLSQQKSVPTDRQTLLMHRYLQPQGLRRSVGTPLHLQPRKNAKIPCSQTSSDGSISASIREKRPYLLTNYSEVPSP